MTTDKQLLKSRFSARLRDYDSLAVVQDAICGQLAEMTGRNCTRPVDSALEIGSGTGFLTRRMLELYPHALWTINDLVEQSADFLEPYAAGHDVRYLWGDAETIALPDRLDLIASASAVQWFDDLPRFARKAGNLLETEGYIVLSTFGPENFREIKAVTDEGLDYYTREQLQELFESAGFLTLETLEYTRSLAFDTRIEAHPCDRRQLDPARTLDKAGAERFRDPIPQRLPERRGTGHADLSPGTADRRKALSRPLFGTAGSSAAGR